MSSGAVTGTSWQKAKTLFGTESTLEQVACVLLMTRLPFDQDYTGVENQRRFRGAINCARNVMPELERFVDRQKALGFLHLWLYYCISLTPELKPMALNMTNAIVYTIECTENDYDSDDDSDYVPPAPKKRKAPRRSETDRLIELNNALKR